MITAIYIIGAGVLITFALAGFMFLADYGKGYNFMTMDDGTDDDQ